MELTHLLLLLGAGLAAGFVAGLIGVGGGIIFAPVLFFHYQSIGVPADVIAPLTIGSSLFCTLLAAIASTWTQYARKAVTTHIAVPVGLFSALVVLLMTHYVTTNSWYDGTVFQAVFSIVLLIVVARMIFRGRSSSSEDADQPPKAEQAWPLGTEPATPSAESELASMLAESELTAPHAEREETRPRPAGTEHSWPTLAGAGAVAGAVSAAAGVGGGVVLVPAYSHFMGLPIHKAAGTSSATIVLIAFVGVVNYALLGLGETNLFGAVGYVDGVRALVLAVPSLFTAGLGVHAAHRINQRALRLVFAAIAAVVAVRLLVEALG